MTSKKKRVIDYFEVNYDEENCIILKCDSKCRLIKDRSSKRTKKKEMSESIQKAIAPMKCSNIPIPVCETSEEIDLKINNFLDSEIELQDFGPFNLDTELFKNRDESISFDLTF